MKPDWNDAPEWARYLAMDSDGEWFWYENAPLQCDASWGPIGMWKHAGWAISWRDTLEERPKD